MDCKTRMSTNEIKVERNVHKEENAKTETPVEHYRYGVILEHQGKYLCVIENKSNFIGFPKGSQEPSESRWRCAQRELKEEAGVDISLCVLRKAKRMLTFRNKQKALFYGYFLVRWPNLKTPPIVSIGRDEISSYMWLTLDELNHLPLNSTSWVTQNIIPKINKCIKHVKPSVKNSVN